MSKSLKGLNPLHEICSGNNIFLAYPVGHPESQAGAAHRKVPEAEGLLCQQGQGLCSPGVEAPHFSPVVCRNDAPGSTYSIELCRQAGLISFVYLKLINMH